MINAIGDDRKMDVIVNHLDGTALNLHRNLIIRHANANPPSKCAWEEFKTLLLNTFRQHDQDDRLQYET
jgi:hypothetical protein